MKDFKLTDHFWLHEFLVSRDHPELAESLNPTEYHIRNIYIQCAYIWQPVRDRLDVPIIISSGYRDPALNTAVGGSPNSLHMDASASDAFVIAHPNIMRGMFIMMRDEMMDRISQLIWYPYKNMIHAASLVHGAWRCCQIRHEANPLTWEHFDIEG